MDIRDVIAAKHNLERTILYFIQDNIKEFEEKTGIKIADLRLRMNTVEDDYERKRKEIAGIEVIVIL